ncbi:MAG TPA: GNAT family N-acetyltransferase [Pyrinomonadaceae bacterium]|nr:GNAT family N-acetyltransferase [Pyrinomonadaceae bacterium]
MAIIEKLDQESGEADLPQLVGVFQDAINNGASLGFLPPLTAANAEKFWRKILAEVGEGSRVLLVARENGRIAGTVQAELAMKENGQHRAEVQKLMVHTSFRRRGIARALLKALEEEAQKISRTLLVLDTELGSEAEKLYPTCGYERVGVIPQFAVRTDRTFVSTVVFYKTLD